MIDGNGIAEAPASGASTTGATGAAAGISSVDWSKEKADGTASVRSLALAKAAATRPRVACLSDFCPG